MTKFLELKHLTEQLLVDAGISDMEKLLNSTAIDLLKIPGFSKKRVDEVINSLSIYGLNLKPRGVFEIPTQNLKIDS